MYIWIKWWALVIIIMYSILFELIENTTFGVKIAKVVCFDPKYEGDLIGNSICDIVCNIIGGLVGINIEGLTGYEIGIALSVLLLGSALAADKTIPSNFAMIAVGVFAIFHGYAHGEEIPTVAEPIPYVSGFMMGTIMLHITGLILADISTHYNSGKIILRVAGFGIALSGLYFLSSVFI